MLDAPPPSHTASIELEDRTLRFVSIIWAKNTPNLDRADESILEEGDVKPLYIAIKKETLLITALPSTETLVRPLEIKLKKQRDIAAVFKFQLEPLLPFPGEAGLASYTVLEQTSDGTLLTVIAARKEHIQKQLDLLAVHQLDPEIVTSESEALVHFGNHFHDKDSPYFIVHIGGSHTTCALVNNRKLIASQAFLIGHKSLNTDLEQLKRDLLRTLFALEKKAKNLDISEVLLTGNCFPDESLSGHLFEKSNKVVCLPETKQGFDLSVDGLQRFAIPLGAALSTRRSSSINFRQENLSYPHRWKRFQKPLALYVCLSIGLAAAFYSFGTAYIGYEEDWIRKEYVELLSSMKKPYHHFESDYLAKNPIEKRDDDEEILPPKKLSQQEILGRLNYLHNEIKSTPDMFPLLPNTPRVSDVLAWLGSHPQVVKAKTADDPAKTLLHLESFNYAMTKRPDQTKRQERYQVKVELEFTAATPKLAREFHDALIAPNEIVDPKGEVKWSSNRGKYKTSFFLKDKTMYPR